MSKRHTNDGLRKRCAHPRKQWAKCGCPWHFSFYKKKCACAPGDQCTHDNQVRVSLNKHFRKPTRYHMSKSEAEALRDKLRGEIRDGTFGADAKAQPAPADTRLTFGDVVNLYLDKHVRVPTRRPGPIKATEYRLAIIRGLELPAANGRTVKLGEKAIADITKADLDAAREARRVQLRKASERRASAIAEGKTAGRLTLPGTKRGEVGVEHMMAMLRHVFDWAIGEGYIDATPFKRHGKVVVQVRTVKKIHRRRRLDPDAHEEERLLAGARPAGGEGMGGRAEGMANHLYDLIIAALETGCRVGELLSLQWRQVKSESGVARYIDLPADKTKTNDPRIVPLTSRLRAVLDFRRTGPDGTEHGPDAYVFGNEAGERVGRISRAWRAACRRAKIENLHFHDLRHECISRMLDAGVPIHKVRDWAGHKNISTTGIYANTTLAHLDEARKQFEERRPIGTRLAQPADPAGSSGDATVALNACN